jgi:PiT family inorganic phosphate transporter
MTAIIDQPLGETMLTSLYFIYFVIALAFLFDFINGFHDAANSVATIVSTGVLKPIWAVIWAAFFNFIAFLIFHLTVANTVGTGLVSPHVVSPYLIFAALTGAIIWNLFTWYLGLPSSSSHALIGGLIGAAAVKGGFRVLNFAGISKVIISIVLSPILGMVICLLLMSLVNQLYRYFTSDVLNRWFGRIQFISAGMLSLGHGGNDAQKTMGIIAVLLFSTGMIGDKFYVPHWVVVSCNLVMALGTLAGGWRIVDTLGKKITKLTPMSGSCAEAGAALTLFLANDLGIPVSTTHTVTGAIAGVGVSKGFFSSQKETIKRIIWAWVITIPAAGLVSGTIILVAKLY